ncbi:MAG TPA: hypothetical protein VLY03_02175 [Bacteroidota bacterium]|nr:hypothetical protein [Bacteroidota bacterium]
MRIAPIISGILIAVSVSAGQEQAAITDTSGMPRLEIPEITIIGKKAITLPFARKGEIYDVDIYKVPPPDSTLLQDRPPMPLPVGRLPRYDEPLVPLHYSVEGSLGSYFTGGARGYLDYTGNRWGISGNAGFDATQGHTDHASGSAVGLETHGHALIDAGTGETGAFLLNGGILLRHEVYGLFGAQDPSTDRTQNSTTLSLGAGTLGQDVNAVNFRLAANFLSVSDDRSGVDSSVSTVSPEVSASLRTKAGVVGLSSDFSFRSSSLDYAHPVELPSLLDFSAGAEWSPVDRISLRVGGTYDEGSTSNGDNRSILAPFGEVKWEIDQDRSFRFWIRPSMDFRSYGDFLHENPYLSRELDIRPERAPVHFGGTFWYNAGLLSLEINGSFSKTSNTAVTIAQGSTLILNYVDASKLVVRGDATLRVENDLLLLLFGVVQPSVEDGTTTQLPMVPLVKLGGRAESSLGTPLNFWSTAEYWSKQNVDLAGSTTLGDRVLFGVGASGRIAGRVVLSGSIENLFNTAYNWWNGYIAPGRQFMLNARVNLQ